MSKMNINANIHVDQEATFSATKAHDLRNLPNDSNQASINADLKDYVIDFNADSLGAQSADELLHEHYDEYIADHDAKKLKSRHKKDCFNDIDGLEKQMLSRKRGKALTSRGLVTFGTMNDKEKILKMINRQIRNINPKMSDNDIESNTNFAYCTLVNDGLKQFAIEHNKRFGDSFPITEAVTNPDETGAPHMHIEQVPLGHTNKGKPTNTINSALQGCYPNQKLPANEALKKYNADCDAILIDTMNKSFDKFFSGVEFNLTKAGTHASTSMVNYKLAHAKSMEKSAKAKLKKVEKLNSSVSERTKELDQRTSDVEKRESKVKQQESDIAMKAKHVKKREDAVEKREFDVANREKSVNDNIINMTEIFKQIKQHNDAINQNNRMALLSLIPRNQDEDYSQFNQRVNDYVFGRQTFDTSDGAKSGTALVTQLTVDYSKNPDQRVKDRAKMSRIKINKHEPEIESTELTPKQKSFLDSFSTQYDAIVMSHEYRDDHDSGKTKIDLNPDKRGH